jgi:hypothetical protein
MIQIATSSLLPTSILLVAGHWGTEHRMVFEPTARQLRRHTQQQSGTGHGDNA